MKKPQSMAAMMVSQLMSTVRQLKNGYFGAAVRVIIDGVTDKGTFVAGMTADAFLARIGDVLVACARIYRFGNSIVYERPGDAQLITIATQGRADPMAAAVLANLVAIGVEREDGSTQSLLPAKLVAATMADEALGRRLPRILHHSSRPCFDRDFRACSPGWNAEAGILVHAATPEVTAWVPGHGAEARAIDRLPVRLKGALREFAWRSDADLVNALAMLLTGLLINLFGDDPHPAGIVDGNTPGSGKTLLVQLIARILDGVEPPRIPLGRDEELEKRLCAQVLSSTSRVFFLDNVRSQIESAVLEQNALSPTISFRVLGQSRTIERPNTYLWFVTSNLTRGTTDFLRRAVPIRLFVEGDPRRRRFQGDPIAHAIEHRQAILGELMGMVLRWVEQGRPPGRHSHRCRAWAATIGGILDACGLGEFFLANLAVAEEEMDQELQDLVTLAEHAVARGVEGASFPAGTEVKTPGLPPAQWVKVAVDAQVLRDRLAEGNPRGKSTAVGIFFSGKVDRPVSIQTPDGIVTATLRRREAGGNQKFYYFEVGGGEPAGIAGGLEPAAPPVEPGLEGAGTSQEAGRPALAPPSRASAPSSTGAGGLEWL